MEVQGALKSPMSHGEMAREIPLSGEETVNVENMQGRFDAKA